MIRRRAAPYWCSPRCCRCPWLALSVRTTLWPYAFHATILFLLCLAVRRGAGASAPPREYHGRRARSRLHRRFLRSAVTVMQSAAYAGHCSRRRSIFRAKRSPTGGNPFPIQGRELVRIRPGRRGTLRIETCGCAGADRCGSSKARADFPWPEGRGSAQHPPGARRCRGLYFRDALLGTKSQRDAGEGAEFESLREYAPGLDTRFIDWKHSARHRRMLVREFRTERNHPIVLAFDTGHLMREPVDGMPRLDHSINAGLLLARVALAASDLVGAYSFDSRCASFCRRGGGPCVSPVAAVVRGDWRIRRMRRISRSEWPSANKAAAAGPSRAVHGLHRYDTAELLVENIRRLPCAICSSSSPCGITCCRRCSKPIRRGIREIARAVLAADFLRERRIVLENCSGWVSTVLTCRRHNSRWLC